MTADGTAVRPATPGEVDAAVAVWRAANEARTGGPPDPPEVEAMVRGWIAAADAMLFVAERGGRIIGMTLAVAGREVNGTSPAAPNGRIIAGLCHVSLVFVAPDVWGQGIGSRLLDAVLDEASQQGYLRAQLWTHETNVRARRLYVSRQFALTGDRAVNPAGETIMRFERPLERAHPGSRR